MSRPTAETTPDCATMSPTLTVSSPAPAADVPPRDSPPQAVSVSARPSARIGSGFELCRTAIKFSYRRGPHGPVTARYGAITPYRVPLTGTFRALAPTFADVGLTFGFPMVDQRVTRGRSWQSPHPATCYFSTPRRERHGAQLDHRGGPLPVGRLSAASPEHERDLRGVHGRRPWRDLGERPRSLPSGRGLQDRAAGARRQI